MSLRDQQAALNENLMWLAYQSYVESEVDMLWTFMNDRCKAGWRFEFLPGADGKDIVLNADKGRDHPRFVGQSMGECVGKFKNWYDNHKEAEHG